MGIEDEKIEHLHYAMTISRIVTDSIAFTSPFPCPWN